MFIQLWLWTKPLSCRACSVQTSKDVCKDRYQYESGTLITCGVEAAQVQGPNNGGDAGSYPPFHQHQTFPIYSTGDSVLEGSEFARVEEALSRAESLSSRPLVVDRQVLPTYR